jgi:hypothetical protein
MKPNPIRNAVIALLALIIALAAAYWLDHALVLVRQRASQTFDYTYSLWLPGLAELLLAAGLIGLMWWLAARASFPRAIDIVYVLVGLTAALSVPLTFTTNVNLLAFLAITNGPLSLWTMTGALLAMAGLFHLFRRRPAD